MNLIDDTMNLVTGIEYADNSVVSKTIFKNPHSTMTLFAFDKDQFLSEHAAAFDAIVQIIDGMGRITINGVDKIMNSGDTIVMPANIKHAVFAVEKFKMLLTMIK